MGCRELDIRSQFYFVGADEKSHSREGTADYTRKTAYSRFSHTVISNYRYYSPELGRWLNRDPINQMGSTAWWDDNPERIRLQKRLKEIERKINNLSLISYQDPIVSSIVNESISRLREQYLAVQYELQMDLLGKRGNGNNDNPYSHTSNNPVNKHDLLGKADPVTIIIICVCGYLTYKLLKTWIDAYAKAGAHVTGNPLVQQAYDNFTANPTDANAQILQQTMEDAASAAHDVTSAAVDVTPSPITGSTGQVPNPIVTSGTEAATEIINEGTGLINQ